eukprot:TRINITY_DN29190_c0_g1_i1.p1 TRINITY_DN29190_c0_g1~~TRINITY_DN29190_c0_g1_i1.p1  ORF type:complete len:713 (-),score=260.64 TRINITY_DN29190_c0_g1_i1:65-2203(-)
MVRRSARSATKKTRPRGDEALGLDDIDQFHKQRSKNIDNKSAPLPGEGQNSDEDEDHEVFGLGDDESSSDSGSSSDGDDSGSSDGSDSSDDDSSSAGASSSSSSTLPDPEDIEGGAGWGSKRSLHYGADDASAESDVEREELAEAQRLQRKQLESLAEEDFELSASDSDSDDSDAKAKKASKIKSSKRTSKKKLAEGNGVSLDDLDVRDAGDSDSSSGAVVVEHTKKKGDIPLKEKIRLVKRDSPELAGLLTELVAKLGEVKEQLGPVLQHVQGSEGVSTDKGISYLEVKYHLLLNYCMNVTFYLLLKVNGRTPRDHPVVEHLVELRTVMEKLRPLDSKLKFQIDKLLALASSSENGTSKDENMTGRANVDNVIDDDIDDEQGRQNGDGDNVYRPPKMMSVQYDETETRGSAKERKEARRAAERQKKSSVLRELREEFSEAPREVGTSGFGDGKTKDDEKEAEREEYEEENFVRLQLSKKDKKRREKRNEQRVNFFEDFNDFEAMADAVADSNTKEKAASVMTQVAQAAQQEKQRRKQAARSGDADLPLGEDRRRDRDRRLQAKAAADSTAAPFDDEYFGGMKDRDEMIKATEAQLAAAEDELYRDVVNKTKKRKREKEDAAVAEQYYVQSDEEGDDDKRQIGYNISKNRGLTRYRKKEDKNPRAKKRKQYEKAKIKRKGQVREHDTKSARQAYGGESTGIRKDVTRSVKFN